MIVEWKGKIGYGDVVSPLCYAQNQSEIRSERTLLKFHWPYGKQQDPESLPNRVDAIVKYVGFPGVDVVHKFNSELPCDHTNYTVKALDDDYKFHNVYFPKVSIRPEKFVVCSPINNEIPLGVYGKRWKDGLTKQDWRDIVVKYDAVHVDYRTPISELLSVMSKCEGFIGYHGSCAWVARLFGLNMTVHSRDRKMSEWAFPWCNGVSTIEIARFDRDEYIIESIRRLRLEP